MSSVVKFPIEKLQDGTASYVDGCILKREWDCGAIQWFDNGERIDGYGPDVIKNQTRSGLHVRERLIEVAMTRSYSRNLYLADIDRIFPKKSLYERLRLGL